MSRDVALQLDAQDELASFREAFFIADPDQIYLDGNSLGRLSRAVIGRVREAVEREWGVELINSWNDNWWQAPRRVGEKIAGLLGAAPGQVVVSDQTSVNLFKLAAAALKLRPARRVIISDSLNFPSDLYVLQGLIELIAGSPTFGVRPASPHTVVRIESADGIIPDLAALERAIDEDTALVTLSHVAFKSGYLYDMQSITRMAQRRGALVLWDLSHSAGVVPIELDLWGVDFAIGCTYKYLNGGPGSPAFLYVNKAQQGAALSPIWGWWGEADPFDFGVDYEPARGVDRFMAGTPPILSTLAMEAAISPLLEAGVARMRAKSVRMTEYALELFDAMLAPLGFALGSPRDPDRRGSHLSLRHPDGYQINRALIEEMKVIPDFRAPDSIRLGFAPLYTSFIDVWEAFDRTRRVVAEKRYEKYPKQRLTVT